MTRPGANFTWVPAAGSMTEPEPHPLSAPQTARYAVRAGDKFSIESEVRVTPLGLLAVGGLVAAILLAAAPLARAKTRRVEALMPPRD